MKAAQSGSLNPLTAWPRLGIFSLETRRHRIAVRARRPLQRLSCGAASYDILTTRNAMEEQGEVTRLLQRVSGGDPSAEELLIPLVYAELHRLASHSLRTERREHTLQATALVNEAYLCLCRNAASLRDRAHFFRLAARLMRRILIDYARSRGAAKRGDGLHRLHLDESMAVVDEQLDTALAVDELLNRLAAFSPRQAQVVEMKFFSGLTEDEIGAVLEVDSRTVSRDWLMARAWLHRQMTGL